MKRLAIFVEGQTDQILVEKLIIEIAGRNNIKVLLQKAEGGKSYSRKFVTIKGDSATTDSKYFVLIVDSSSDLHKPHILSGCHSCSGNQHSS